MIAQVVSGTVAAGPLSDEMHKFTESAFSEARKRDGVEGCLTVFDPATGELLNIMLFRDQAALNAFQAFSQEKIVEATGELGAEVAANRVYSEVIAAL
jgi:hypothetical protein